MKGFKRENQTTFKAFIGGIIAVGLITGLFMYIIGSIEEMELEKSYKVATTYETEETANILEEVSYEEADYSFKIVTGSTVENTALSANLATGIGAKYLSYIYGIDTSGLKFNLRYERAVDYGLSRSIWHGTCYKKNKYNYIFRIDAITGRIRYIANLYFLEVDSSINTGEKHSVNEDGVPIVDKYYFELFYNYLNVLNIQTDSIGQLEYNKEIYNNEPVIEISGTDINSNHQIRIVFSRNNERLIELEYYD